MSRDLFKRSAQADNSTPLHVRERPPIRWTTDEMGKSVRAYRCAPCRDTGTASLPEYRPDETGIDLIGEGVGAWDHKGRPLRFGKRYAYPCPVCHKVHQGLSQAPLDRRHQIRLQKWLTARREQIQEWAAEAYNERQSARAVVTAAQQLANPVPDIGEQERREISTQERQ